MPRDARTRDHDLRWRATRSASAIVVGLAMVAGTAGCAADGRDDTPAPTSSAAGTASSAAADPETLREELAAQYAGDHPQRSDRQEAACFADALLERRDPGALAVAGLVDAEGHLVEPFPTLDADTAGAWVDAQEECTDFVTASTEAFAAQTKGRLDQDAYAECLSERIAPDRVHEALVASLSGGLDSPAVVELTQAQSTCVTEALPQD